MLKERMVPEPAVTSLEAIAYQAGIHGYHKIQSTYARTDFARNNICKLFLELSSHDDDVLVMLDNDHIHPENVVELLATKAHDIGVCGALAFRRGEPYDPLFFLRDPNRAQLFNPAELDFGQVYQCAIVSTSAIAIKRWVFMALAAHGYGWPWFKYEYTEGMPSEDMYFGKICEQSGIPHYVDTNIIIPHLTWGAVERGMFEKYKELHPEKVKALFSPAEGVNITRLSGALE